MTFSRILGIADPSVAGRFQVAVRDRYPVTNQAGAFQLQVGVGPEGPQIQQGNVGSGWLFADREDMWKITLAPEFLTLETRGYEEFPDFLGRLRHALDALIEQIRPAILVRVGLRYINEIRAGQHPNWGELVRPELLGPLAIPQFAAGAVQAVQQVLFRYEDGHGVNLRHGLLAEGTTVQPRPGAQLEPGPFYLLDLDAFREFPKPGGAPFDAELICRQVEQFNRAVYQLFRRSVTDRYIASLGVLRHAEE